MADSETLWILVKAKDLASGVLKGVGKNVDGIGKTASRGLGTAIGNIEKLGLAGAAAAGGGLLYAVKQASNFEAQLNTINTVAHLSQEELAGVGEGIRQLARDTGASTDDLTTAYYDLVSAGVQAKDAQGVLTAANTLAIGALGTNAETVDLLTTALNSYGIEASQAGTISDYFAQSVAAGKTTVSEIASSFAQVGSIAATSGIEIQELAAGYAQLTAKGTPAAEASTQMRAAIVALQKPTANLRALQKKLGVDFAKVAREQGLAAAYQQIREAADAAGIPMVQLTGRIEAANYAFQVTGDNAAGYATNLDAVEKASDGAGVAADQAAERQKGLAFQWGRLKAAAKDIGITIGTELLPPLADLAKQGADWLGKPEQQANLKQFAKDLAQGVKDLIATAKTVDWSAVASSLQSAAGFAKGIVDAFLGAPAWLQSAVLTGWGLNKLTGGAVGSIVGQLASGMIKGVLGMTAGVVNIKAGTVVGGGGGVSTGGGAAGAAGSMAGGLVQTLKVAGSMFLAGVAIDQLFQQWGRFEQQVHDASEAVMDKVATIPDKTYTQALAATGTLASTLKTQSGDLLTSVLQQTGTGKKETFAAFQELAANLERTAQTPAERQAASDALSRLADQIATNFSVTEGDKAAIRSELTLDGILAELQKPPAPIVPGPTTVLPGPGFTEYMHAQTMATEGLAPDLQAIAAKLDVSHDGQVQLREVMADKLGLTVGALMTLKMASGGWNATLASKLGISNADLASILSESRQTTDQLSGVKSGVGRVEGAINRKDLSVKVNVNVSTTVRTSSRTIASDNFRVTRNAGVGPIVN